MNERVLYIGGFELPDGNAAAQRVIGIAKALRRLGNEVIFINSLTRAKLETPFETNYYGFKCIECQRKGEVDYRFIGRQIISLIKRINPTMIIAYNYPACPLNKIRRYSKRKKIKCYVDVTEWYGTSKWNFYNILKRFDTAYRMNIVQKKMDGVIAISRFLYDYYKKYTRTVLIPPLVDVNDKKWIIEDKKNENVISFVYAGNPSAKKERLDIIVEAVDHLSLQYCVLLNVVGITKEQFINIYSWKKPISNAIQFWGWIDHRDAIKIVKNSDWTVILREDNRVTRAGFPTKLVESISCGIPVIVNRFSNITDYLDENNSLIIENEDSVENVLEKSCLIRKVPNKNIFDYRCFTDKLECFLKSSEKPVDEYCNKLTN